MKLNVILHQVDTNLHQPPMYQECVLQELIVLMALHLVFKQVIGGMLQLDQVINFLINKTVHGILAYTAILMAQNQLKLLLHSN